VARKCVFCGESPTRKEHALPLWLRDLLLRGTQASHEWGAYVTGENRKWLSSGPDFTAKIVCDTCNHGWMSDLESEAQPWLTPMIAGRAQTLEAAALRTCARWAMKTAMTIDRCAATSYQSIPASRYPLFYEKQQPSLGVSIWIGGSTALGGFWAQNQTPTLATARGVVQGYALTLRFRHLVFHLLGIEGNYLPSPEIGGKLGQAFTRIWPMVWGNVQWPPNLLLSEAEAEQLGKLLGEGA
jgi:hypothetical protein